MNGNKIFSQRNEISFAIHTGCKNLDIGSVYGNEMFSTPTLQAKPYFFVV